ncbi:uncharacterized protein HD556DRAFT_992744 [Suillus plorans]|uniref:Uncharacterized protein n=1 Tax=Suillus plorans TaxID=116603 RepID=A0A9P7ADL2_9AGAM|nr:uncharacterized protein HD556DRAFT_992744 [Suillus plorans]KAG1787151.1 hypothetical protein HD556DRAFT_992744 [Suillus plorans]
MMRSSVVIFDHTICHRCPVELDDDPQRRQPVSRARVDQTPAAYIARVHRHIPPTEAPSLLCRRFQIINLWRLISHAAVDWPLALCDFRSVHFEKDLVPVDKTSCISLETDINATRFVHEGVMNSK